MAVIGSTDLGDGRLALTVDVDPTVSFPAEASAGDIINYNGAWWRADSSSSAIPEMNFHQHLHEAGGIDELSVQGLSGELADQQEPKAHAPTHQDGGTDEVATATPGANDIPKAGATGELDKDWLPVMVGSGGSAAKGAVPEPPATPGTDLFLREDGTWQQPATGYTEWTYQSTTNDYETALTIPMTDQRTWLIKMTIVGFRDNGDDYAGYIREAVFYRDGGGAVRIGQTNTPLNRETTQRYNVRLEVSGNNIIVEVRGRTGHDVNWKGRYTLIEVG